MTTMTDSQDPAAVLEPAKASGLFPTKRSRWGAVLVAVVLVAGGVGYGLWQHFGTAGTASQAKLDQAKSSCETFYNQRAQLTGVYTSEVATGTREVQQVVGHAAFPDGSSADFTCLVKLSDHDALVNLESLTATNVVSP